MTLQAIIFDVDGTLAETEELHRAAFNAAFAEAGQDWSWDRGLYADLLEVEGGLERIRAYVERARPRDLARLENERRLEAIHARKTEIYASMLEDGAARLRPGVARLLRDARSAGVRIGVCTTSRRDSFEALILNAFGFEALDWFAAIVSGDDPVARKPSPEPYLLALERLGVPAAAAMAIEDSARGVAAANAAGLRVIAAPGLYTAKEDFSDALLTLSDLGEPGAPFDVIAGDPGHHSFVSVEALRRWKAEACAPGDAAA